MQTSLGRELIFLMDYLAQRQKHPHKGMKVKYSNAKGVVEIKLEELQRQ